MKWIRLINRFSFENAAVSVALLWLTTATLSAEDPVSIENPSSHLLSGKLGENHELSVYLSVLDDEGSIGIRVVDPKTQKAIYTIDLELSEKGLSKVFYSKIENGKEIILRDEDGDLLPDRKLVMTPDLVRLFELSVVETLKTENPRMPHAGN